MQGVVFRGSKDPQDPHELFSAFRKPNTSSRLPKITITVCGSEPQMMLGFLKLLRCPLGWE